MTEVEEPTDGAVAMDEFIGRIETAIKELRASQAEKDEPLNLKDASAVTRRVLRESRKAAR
jgi:hypothetical protein